MEKTEIANLPEQVRRTDTVEIGIAGMTCDRCVQKVEQALRSLAGIKEVQVDRARALARVVYDNSLLDVPAMHDALLRSGYTPVPLPVR